MIEHQKHSNSFNSLNKKIEILILSIKNKTALTAVTVNRIISMYDSLLELLFLFN